MRPPVFADVLRARQRLAGRLPVTPLAGSEWLSAVVGTDIRLKLESLQLSHSFKVRGALNSLLAITEEGDRPAVVTASAGNHGRAIAWAAALLGLDATVFTPRGAPRTKLDAIRRHGATLRAEAADYEDAERRALDYAREHGVAFVSPYDHPEVIAGGGTVGLEIVDQWPDVEAVIVPVGGGGLISGIAIALKALRREAAVIGVEAEASSAFTASREAGRIVRIEARPTIADGLGGNFVEDSMAWPIVRDRVDDMIVVGEQALVDGIRQLIAEERLVAEGAGIAGVAALASRALDLAGRRAAVVLTGANIDPDTLATVLHPR